MILTDSSGKILVINKQTEVLFGYERNELIGKKIEILVPQRMKDHHPKHRKKFHDHPKARPMGAGRDLYGVKKDGTEIPVEIGLNPIEKDGELLVLASVIDITERKKNEEAIRLYARQIEEKNKELEEFSNVASHDLREPLNSIISFTELLIERKSDQLDEDGIKMLDFISKSSSRMAELIIGLLDYAHLGNSKELVMNDLNKLLLTVLLDLDSSIKASNAEINVGKMPVLNVYSMEFRLLFQNLISNALKYRKPEVAPQISISAKQVKNGWEFAISDNGIGIPEAQKEKVFNLFHRLHKRNEYEGTGIGLAHCRKIAEHHRGRIWVESEVGRGSTFYFFIPSDLK
jgi:PAS domain S-box-containing protein